MSSITDIYIHSPIWLKTLMVLLGLIHFAFCLHIYVLFLRRNA